MRVCTSRVVVTVLSVSVLSYRDAAGVERYVAVRGGVLHVRGGSVVEVAVVNHA